MAGERELTRSPGRARWSQAPDGHRSHSCRDRSGAPWQARPRYPDPPSPQKCPEEPFVGSFPFAIRSRLRSLVDVPCLVRVGSFFLPLRAEGQRTALEALGTGPDGLSAPFLRTLRGSGGRHLDVIRPDGLGLRDRQRQQPIADDRLALLRLTAVGSVSVRWRSMPLDGPPQGDLARSARVTRR